MRRILKTTTALTLCLCSCATTKPPGWFEETRAIHFGEPFVVPDSIKIELGFDEMRRRNAFRDGDRLLYGLRLEKPGRGRTWFVEIFVDHAKKQIEGMEIEHELTMTQTIRRPDGQSIEVKSTVMEVSIRVYDADGKRLSVTSADVARESLALGFREASARFSGRLLPVEGGIVSNDDQELNLKTLATSVSLMSIIEKNEVLSPILWEVVAAPSFASLLFNFGASVAVDTKFTKSEEWTGPLPFETNRPAYRMPVEILANDQPALLASAIVVQPAEPINLSAGIFSIVGVHPSDPAIRVRLELLAARIGSGPEIKTFAEQREGRPRRHRRGRQRRVDR